MQEDHLFNLLIKTTSASRVQIVEYLKLELSRLKSSGMCAAAQTEIIGKVHHVLIQQERVNWTDDEELARVENIAQELMESPKNKILWQEFFDCVDAL